MNIVVQPVEPEMAWVVHLSSYCCWATNVTWVIYTDKSSGCMTLNLNLNQATARPISFLCLQVTDEFLGLFSYEEHPFSHRH